MTRLAALPLALALLTGCSAGSSHGSSDAMVAPSFVPLAPPAEASPQPTLAPVPAPGTVTLAQGPFDDRFTLDGLALATGTVTALLTITSDVSDLINLEVAVAFYGTDGALLGTGRQVTGTDESEPFHTTAGVAGLPLRIDGPVGASSAVVRIPVLVNE